MRFILINITSRPMLRLNLVLLGLTAAAWLLGLFVFPIEFTTKEVLHQAYLLSGILSWFLMTECIVLAARPAWIERLTGESMERLMQAHRKLGWGAVAAAFLHFIAPLYASLLPARPVPMMDGHRMDSLLEALWIWSHPVCALSGIVVSLWILSIIWRDVRRARGAADWTRWESGHRKWALAFLLMAPHCLRLPKEVEMIMPLGLLNLGLTLLGCWAAWGTLRRRPGWQKRTEGCIRSVSAHDGLIRLEVESPRAREFSAGQHAYLSLPGDREDPHPFSVAGIDRTQGTLLFWIRGAGGWTKALAAAEPARPVLIEGPWGRFEPRFGKGDAWVAAGTGIAPFRAWLEEVVRQGIRAEGVTLHWSVREAASFAPEIRGIREFCAKCGVTLRLFETKAAGRRLTPGDIVTPATRRLAVCGPKDLMTDLRKAWTASGRSPADFSTDAS